MCTWCRSHVAFLPSLGADGPACSAQGGFCCLFSRAGHWVTTHPPWILHVLTCRRRPRGQCPMWQSPTCRQHTWPRWTICRCELAASRSLWPPHMAVVSKGAKTFTNQVGQRQVSVDRLKAHTGDGLVSPAGVAFRGQPPKKPATPTIQPASL
jgi:hypothetical protein